MTHCHHDHGRPRGDWDDAGRAAEDFARRMARDAQRFGERVAEHASAFARELAREWRHGHAVGTAPLTDVREMLKEVRGLVGDVIDGLDELIGRIFQGEAARSTEPWARVVTSREVPCAGCGRRIEPGEECHLQRQPDGRRFRCATCGPPAPETPPNA